MAQIASDVKGQDLCLLHVTPLCTWTSWMLLVSVTSRPQQQAVLACVTQEAKGRWDRAPRSASTGQFVSSPPPFSFSKTSRPLPSAHFNTIVDLLHTRRLSHPCMMEPAQVLCRRLSAPWCHSFPMALSDHWLTSCCLLRPAFNELSLHPRKSPCYKHITMVPSLAV